MRRRTRLLLFVVGLICADGRQLFAQQEYVNLIERYARCDDRAPYDLAEGVISIWSGQPVPPALVGTAAVLHTHAALVTQNPDEAGWHLDRAEALLGRSPGPMSAKAPRSLYLDLYVIRAAYLHIIRDALRLRNHLQQLPPDLPGVTGLLLRAGAAEFYNTSLVSSDDRPKLGKPVSWFDPEDRELPFRLLREVLATSPGDAEAHVRLGRLLLLAGKLDEAEAHLRHALESRSPEVIRYWAHLLLGRLFQKTAALGEAETAYREAVRLEPSAQSARLALAQLLWTTGRVDEASNLLDITIANGATGATVRDPWWDYAFGAYWRRDELLGNMQRIVRGCR